MPTKFDPNKYKNKKTIRVNEPLIAGLFTIWDWSKTKKKYCKRIFGNTYYVTKRINGKEHTKCITSRSEACRWLAEYNPYDTKDESNITFDALMQRYFKKRKGEIRISTYETYSNQSRHLSYLNDFKVLEITPRVIDDLIMYLKRPCYLKKQNSTRLSYKKLLGLLNQMLVYFSEYIYDEAYSTPLKKRHLRDSIIDKEKYDQVKAKGKRKFLTREEFTHFLNVFKEYANEKPKLKVFYQIALVQFTTGLRVGEVCALTWKDINFDDGKVVISKSVAWSRNTKRKTYISKLTKTGEIRTVYLSDYVLNELRKFKLSSGNRFKLVFTLDGKNPVEYRGVQSNYDKMFKKIGTEWRGTHIARHSFATDFLTKTQNPKALQSLLGHKTSEQTEHYAKITNTLTKKGFDIYSESINEISNQLSKKTVGKVLENE